AAPRSSDLGNAATKVFTFCTATVGPVALTISRYQSNSSCDLAWAACPGVASGPNCATRRADIPASAAQKTSTKPRQLVAVIECLDLLERFQRLRGPGISRLAIKLVKSITGRGIAWILGGSGLCLLDRFGYLPESLVGLRKNYVVGIFIGLQADCFFREIQRSFRLFIQQQSRHALVRPAERVIAFFHQSDGFRVAIACLRQLSQLLKAVSSLIETLPIIGMSF